MIGEICFDILFVEFGFGIVYFFEREDLNLLLLIFLVQVIIVLFQVKSLLFYFSNVVIIVGVFIFFNFFGRFVVIVCGINYGIFMSEFTFMEFFKRFSNFKSYGECCSYFLKFF